MIIPWQELEEQTLINIVESFILREGTDYGMEELPLATKRATLLAKIKQGDAIIVWSELHQSLDIKDKSAFLG
ncbi:YheU family protein [Volucribacter amazonae]|uniref:Uncharacterized protein n=1 Tax=Volucribacter amazonae TaxID=256731 RepID=A0A9X4PAY4_9PAST|nr:YheU family protein [Volucribacter amazonae]MDG6895728.1 hypothetical protein [Volucribacter amazonae]